MLDPTHPALTGRTDDAILDALIFAAATPSITDVLVGGRHVVRDGQHVARRDIVERWHRTASRLTA